jgi:hypothetical protein
VVAAGHAAAASHPAQLAVEVCGRPEAGRYAEVSTHAAGSRLALPGFDDVTLAVDAAFADP